MKKTLISLIGLCFVLLVLVSCGGILPAEVRGGIYLAEIDRVEPEIPGLIVEETTAVVGEIIVTNETGKDIYIAKMGAGKSRLPPRRFFGEKKMVNGYT